MIEKMLSEMEKLKEKDVCFEADCNECIKKYGSDCDENTQKQAIDRCKKIVQEVAKEYNNGWIPCSERLPERRGYYLATWMSGNEVIGFMGEPIVERLYFKGKEWSVQNAAHRRVIAWQPLPAPYQKGE